MMIRRTCLWWGVLSVVLALGLAATALADTTTPPPKPKPGVDMPKFLRAKVYFGKGTAGDSVAEALLRGIRETYPKINIRTIPGGSKAAVERILANEADLGVGLGTFSYKSWLGEKPFKKAVKDKDAWLWQMPVGLQMTWVVKADSDIKSVKDLADKRINCAAPGTGANMSMIPGILAADGLSYEKIKKNGGFVHAGPMSTAMEMLISGQLDAVMVSEPHPSKTLKRFSLTNKFRFIPLTAKEQASACDPVTGNLSYQATVIPAGTYSWQKNPVPAMATMMGLNVRRELPKDVVYNLMAASWGCWHKWKGLHPAFKNVDFPSLAITFTPIPLHPGAQEFWRDWGMKIPPPLAGK